MASVIEITAELTGNQTKLETFNVAWKTYLETASGLPPELSDLGDVLESDVLYTQASSNFEGSIGLNNSAIVEGLAVVESIQREMGLIYATKADHFSEVTSTYEIEKLRGVEHLSVLLSYIYGTSPQQRTFN